MRSNPNKKLLTHSEVIDLNGECNSTLPDYPLGVLGATGLYVDGKIVICGGGYINERSNELFQQYPNTMKMYVCLVIFLIKKSRTPLSFLEGGYQFGIVCHIASVKDSHLPLHSGENLSICQ